MVQMSGSKRRKEETWMIMSWYPISRTGGGTIMRSSFTHHYPRCIRRLTRRCRLRPRHILRSWLITRQAVFLERLSRVPNVLSTSPNRADLYISRCGPAWRIEANDFKVGSQQGDANPVSYLAGGGTTSGHRAFCHKGRKEILSFYHQ